jgi:hypothetical protein
MKVRVYNQAPTSLLSGTKTTADVVAERLIPADDAPEDYAYNVTLQSGGDYAVNVGYASDHTEFIIPSGGSLTLKIDQLSKIWIKTAQAGQSVNYICYQ